MNKAIITFQKSLLIGLTGAITIAITPAFSQSSSENQVVSRCDIIRGVPVTVAYNPNNQQQPIPIITWRKDYIDSQNIEQDCKNAAEKITKRLNSLNPLKKDFYLVVETQPLKSNSKDEIPLYNVCLASQSGGTCNDGKKLVRLKIESNSEEANKIFSTIINPEFAELGKVGIRNIGRTYPPVSRTFFEKLFGIRR